MMNHDFLERLADGTPTPGGGSAAAFTAAEAAALVAMSAKLTVSNEKYRSIHEEMQAAIEKAENWRKILAEYVNIDSSAFEQILAARRLPHRTPEETSFRETVIKTNTYHAAKVPLEMASICIQVMAQAVVLTAIGNINTIADSACAVSLCLASLVASANNIKINLSFYRQEETAQKMIDEIDHILERAEAYQQQVQILMTARGGIQYYSQPINP